MSTSPLTTDQDLMHRCFQLASHGLGLVAPNPLVGCVVVKDGQILSEGFHQQYGHNHAERNALLRLSDSQALDATLYVNLEPCAHQGKTPPCADLIIDKKIKRVVCCNDDPNPLVSGRGFDKLLHAGIQVDRHILQSEGRHLNRRFFTYIEQQRPYIILKWAESADGFMAPTYKPYWISSPSQTRLSHQWRTQEAAILIGSQTFLDDHPQLTPRLWCGHQPQRIVLDRRGRINNLPPDWLHLQAPDIPSALNQLYQARLQSVIVEGGRTILDAFLNLHLYDEIRIFKCRKTFGNGLPAPKVDNATIYYEQ